MRDTLKRFVSSQSNHSAIILVVIAIFAAKAAGVDIIGLAKWAEELLTILVAISGAAKVILPDAPTPAPGSVVVTPSATGVLPPIVQDAVALAATQPDATVSKVP